ncbi:heterokaryon incompatibility protein-domain-containing protein [Podospora aff. communis PSN243]|uniref:Heterokaryon incompatibility protein-domain-containing protein n=1 Tax=Podospora aff. communis PSN243 TaxID=3040156 RepID=A0AAV9G495_9PEZI|nr:heterokaryon incompatibility protein-domain-containing protein [Podospora aff. communis PSN243]
MALEGTHHPLAALFEGDLTFCEDCNRLLYPKSRPRRVCAESDCPAHSLWKRAIDAFSSGKPKNRAITSITPAYARINIYRTYENDDAHSLFLEVYSSNFKPQSKAVTSRPDRGADTNHILECFPDTGGPCFDQVEEWLAECLAGHPNRLHAASAAGCTAHHATPRLPTRALFLPKDGPEMVVLIETNSGPMHKRYAALSYCWGTTQNIKTTAATMDAFKRGIPISKLPKTMRDAVVVTKRLGIQYLWIDALCIIQDSPSDWELESAQMGAIYRDATLVISASDSPDCHGGLFFKRESPRELALEGVMAPGRLYVRPYMKTNTRIKAAVVHTHADDQMKACALHHRAWTFQERYLATRTIHFGRAELGWTCPSVRICECEGPIPLGVPNTGPTSDFWKRELSNAQNQAWAAEFVRGTDWTGLITEYSRRDLTHNTDLLPALSGIAQILAMSASGERYAFGLWQSGTERGYHLVWRNRSGSPASRNLPHGYVPSWTWASLRAPILFADCGHSIAYRWIFDLVDMACTPATANPFGPGAGKLRLKGYLVPIRADSRDKFRSRRSPKYHVMSTMASNHIPDPKKGEIKLGRKFRATAHANLKMDVFGLDLEDRPEALDGVWVQDVSFPIAGGNATELFFFLLVEVMADPDGGEVAILEPEGIILERATLGVEVCYERRGWGEGFYKYPTEWWKSCGALETVAII